MAAGVHADWGLWYDYNRPHPDRSQILSTDRWSRVLTGTVAVSITLASPYIFELIIWLIFALAAAFTWAKYCVQNYRLLADGEGDTAKSSPTYGTFNQGGGTNDELEAGQTSRAKAQDPDATSEPSATPLTEASHQDDDRRHLGIAEDSRTTVWNFLKSISHGHVKRLPDLWFMIAIAILLIFLFVAQTIASILSAKIATDNIGLVASKHCGIYEFDENAGVEAADLDDLNNHRKEARASQYAETCYNSNDKTGPFSCHLFYNQSISYTTETKQRCPFASPKLCLGGLYSAVTFDTGIVDASVIGVNHRPTHKFRRTSICSPLNVSTEYISQVPGANETTFRYYYGSKEGTNYTFESSGQPFNWLVPVYSVNTYFSSLYPDEDYWHPDPDLAQPEDTTLTIMFISSAHIFHTKPGLDPIFHAEEPKHVGGFQGTYYYNSDPRARPIACVDRTELCSPDGEKCWSMTADVPKGVSSPPAYWIMKLSLENSNAYDSIKWRLGSALLAQNKISQFVSRPLSPVQWQVEASQLFATSLARIQYDALGIATGEGHDTPGYVKVSLDEVKGSLCRLIKVRTTDYINVNLKAFLGIIILVFVLFFLTWKPTTIGLESPGSYAGHQSAIMLDYVLDFTLTKTTALVHATRSRYRQWEDERGEANDPASEHISSPR